MRPLKLRISAFGPYAGETVVPMDSLGEQGLYLVTGDTGAGKTTIFDAICFALFGEASGTTREVSMFRSKYATPDVPTEVELTFSHAGNEYTVKRNPEYMRPAKRGDGETKQTADAQLYMPDGQIVYKVKDVTNAIEEILGVNREQFSQIAMLAQGDFMKLLLADTKTRSEIFRELFKTSPYQTFQFRLEDERRRVSDLHQSARESVKQYISGISVSEDDVLSISVSKAKSGELTTEEILDLLDCLIGNDDRATSDNNGRLEEVENKLEVINKKLGAAKNVENTKRALAEAERDLQISVPVLGILEKTLVEKKDALKEKDSFTAEATKIRAELADYDVLDKLSDDIRSLVRAIVDGERSVEEFKIKEKTEAEFLFDIKEELVKLEDAGIVETKLVAQLDTMNKAKNELKDISSQLKELDRKRMELDCAMDIYSRSNSEFIEFQHEYESLEQAFRDGQAGVLAASLRDGDMCPVCGSKTHPSLAKLSDVIPTKEELDAAKHRAERARSKATKNSVACGTSRGEIESMENLLKETLSKVLGTDDLVEAPSLVNEAIEEMDESICSIEEQIKAERLRKNRKDELSKLVPEKEKGLQNITESISALTLKLATDKTCLDEKESQVNSLKKKIHYENKAAANTKISQLESVAAGLQKEYDVVEKTVIEKKSEVDSIKGSIEGYKKSLADIPIIDLETETQQQEELKLVQKQLTSIGKQIASRYNNNTEIRKNILKKSNELIDIESRLQWIGALADTANGKLKGKSKIMLETYIQTTYFDRIINRANLRLMKMSGNQYEMKRARDASNAKSQSGLELSVIDHYNGSERSVKTLSGGESFMASLSLALGLSDEVQSSAGGIQIDTMFVDEGFGSLDSETLEMAYGALASLTEGNKLVGIISHVNELKEKIDRQIVVTKAKSGGSEAKVVV